MNSVGQRILKQMKPGKRIITQAQHRLQPSQRDALIDVIEGGAQIQ